MDLSDAIKEAYAYANPDDTLFEAYEISQSSWLENILLVDDFRELSTLQGTYKPVKIYTTLPETEEAVRGQMKIAIEFLPKKYRDKIYTASFLSDPIKIQYRQYTEADADPEAELPVPLTVSSVEFNQQEHTMDMTALFPDLVNLPLCRRIMTTTALPGGKI